MITSSVRKPEASRNLSRRYLVAALAYLAAGQKEAAIRLIDRLPDVLPWSGFRAYVHAAANDRVIAARIAREIASRPTSLQDTARALDALERATDTGETWFVWYSIADPIYDPVRKSARFLTLLQRVGLDESMFSRK